MHAGALNGHEPDSLAGHYLPRTRVLLDGLPIGEGHDALRALADEYRGDVVGRIMRIEGAAALVGYSDEGRGPATGIIRLQSNEGRITVVRIDHDAEQIRRLIDSDRF